MGAASYSLAWIAYIQPDLAGGGCSLLQFGLNCLHSTRLGRRWVEPPAVWLELPTFNQTWQEVSGASYSLAWIAYIQPDLAGGGWSLLQFGLNCLHSTRLGRRWVEPPAVWLELPTFNQTWQEVGGASYSLAWIAYIQPDLAGGGWSLLQFGLNCLHSTRLGRRWVEPPAVWLELPTFNQTW